MAAPKSPRAVPTTTINASTPLLHAMRGDVYGEWAQVRIYYRGQLSGSFDVRHGDVDAVVKHINGDPKKLRQAAKRRERQARKRQ